jgi:hypothetical protein
MKKILFSVIALYITKAMALSHPFNSCPYDKELSYVNGEYIHQASYGTWRSGRVGDNIISTIADRLIGGSTSRADAENLIFQDTSMYPAMRCEYLTTRPREIIAVNSPRNIGIKFKGTGTKWGRVIEVEPNKIYVRFCEGMFNRECAFSRIP